MTTWFITGSSRGFGRAVALETLCRGEQVAARDTDAVKDLAAQFGDQVLPLALDVTDPGQIAATVRAAEDTSAASTCCSTTRASANSPPSRSPATLRRVS